METKTNLTRRQFFGTSLKTLAGVGLASSFMGKALSETCGLTPPQTEGPFYPVRDQADKDNDLTWVKGQRQRAKGQIIHVMGIVRDDSCEPLQGALVEIWQACESGKYNHPGDPNPVPLDPNFQYWGRAVSDEKGQYHLITILPGNYPAAPGWIRPSHIHFKIQRRGFHELITQMYFQGNPYNAGDKILMALPPQEREKVVVPFQKSPNVFEFEQGSLVGTFDIGLRLVR